MQGTQRGTEKDMRIGRRGALALGAGALAFGLGVTLPATAVANPSELRVCMMEGVWQWSASAQRWWYLYEDGSYPHGVVATIYNPSTDSYESYGFDDAGWMVTGWRSFGGTWYYFEEAGPAAKGWKLIDGTWYFFAANGQMLKGWMQDGSVWYHFADSGAMATGWQQIAGDWYLFSGSGVRLSGWQQEGGSWYYLDPLNSDIMTIGWQSIDGKSYYFNESGVMAAGWLELGGDWYLLADSGERLSGWQALNGKWYYLDPMKGDALTVGWVVLLDDTYLTDSSGAMVTGWYELGGDWYYFAEDGSLCTSRVVDGGYYVDSNGRWADEGVLSQAKAFSGIWSAKLDDLANSYDDGKACAGAGHGEGTSNFFVTIDCSDPAHSTATLDALPLHGHGAQGTFVSHHAADKAAHNVTGIPFHVEPWNTECWYLASKGTELGVGYKLWLMHEGSNLKLSITSDPFSIDPADGDIYILQVPKG